MFPESAKTADYRFYSDARPFMKRSIRNKIKKEPLKYKEKKPFFAAKEIIFRSGERAKVFNISSQTQVIALSIMLLVAITSTYSYHMYSKSSRIISRKDREIVTTKDAYVNLISDVAILNKNIEKIMSTSNKVDSAQAEEYKKQAELISEKIKETVEEKAWINPEKVNEKMSLSEAVLQRDILASERDDLKEQLSDMEDSIDDLKSAELEVYEKIINVTSKELDKIKSQLSVINEPLKKKGLYYNALSNKEAGEGGPYIPVDSKKNDPKNAQINQKIAAIFDNVDDLEYYNKIMQYIPIGKPVWSYWVTSPFGARADPFHTGEAFHKGVDLASPTGNKIKAMAKGKVIKAEYSGAYGNMVEIDHGNGFITKYAHMHKIYVKKGDNVNIDDTIGEVGSTGRSTGSHLHYEVVYQGTNVDPMPFIKAKQ